MPNMNKKIVCLKRNLFLFFLPFLLTGCAYLESQQRQKEYNLLFEVGWNDSVGKKISDLAYDSGDFHSFDLYLPADSSSPKAKHLILFIHGGSWQRGSKADGEKYCRFFTSKGYVTASIDYTLQDGKHTTWIGLINDEVKTAVPKIKEAAESRGYILSDMAVFGYSAGACQSLLYAFKEKDNSVLPIKFVIDMSGPVTFDPGFWTADAGIVWYEQSMLGLDGTKKGEAKFISMFSGKDVTEEMVANGEGEKIWKEISPATYVDENTVPVLIIFGSCDGIVSPKHPVYLKSLLEKNNVECKCYELPNSGHALLCDNDLVLQFQKTAVEYCEKYFR